MTNYHRAQALRNKLQLVNYTTAELLSKKQTLMQLIATQFGSGTEVNRFGDVVGADRVGPKVCHLWNLTHYAICLELKARKRP